MWVIIAVDCFLDTDSLEMLGIGSDSTSNDAKDLGVPQLFSESFKVFWWVIFPKQTRFFPFGLKCAPVLLKKIFKEQFLWWNGRKNVKMKTSNYRKNARKIMENAN